jgi:hypothetical protein
MVANAAGACVAYAVAGAIWYNGGSASRSIGNLNSGTLLNCVAVDLDNQRIWFRHGATGSWNDTSGSLYDPSVPSSGIDISSLGAAVMPVVGFQASGAAGYGTLNLGAAGFVGAVPAGFTAGWPGVSVPTVPAGLAVLSVTATSITMGWSASSGGGTMMYTLQYRVTGSGSGWTQISGIVALSQTVSGLVSGQFYDFQVEAVNEAGVSGFSPTVVGQTTPPVQPIPPQPQSLNVYRGQVGINWLGMTLLGDAFSGVIGQATFDEFTEYGNMMRGLVTTPVVHKDRKRIFVNRLELDVQSGVGLNSGQGLDPHWVLDWSKDGGRTWSVLKIAQSIGKKGEYRKRLRWMKIGAARQWIFRLTSTDPVRRVIIGTYLDLDEGTG